MISDYLSLLSGVGVCPCLVLGCLWVWVVTCDWRCFFCYVALFSVFAFDSWDWAGFGFYVVFLAVVLDWFCGLLLLFFRKIYGSLLL